MGVVHPHEIPELCRLYADGKPIRHLQERFDTSITTIIKHARRAGLPARSPHAGKWAVAGGRFTPWAYQNDDLEDLVCAGHSEHQIAERLRRTRDGVRHQLRRLGYPSSHATDTELFIALFKAGITFNRCAELIGNSVGCRLLPPTQDRIQLMRFMNEHRATNLEMAELIGVPFRKITDWRREYEIRKPRKHKVSTIADARARILPDGMGGVA